MTLRFLPDLSMWENGTILPHWHGEADKGTGYRQGSGARVGHTKAEIAIGWLHVGLVVRHAGLEFREEGGLEM